MSHSGRKSSDTLIPLFSETKKTPSVNRRAGKKKAVVPVNFKRGDDLRREEDGRVLRFRLQPGNNPVRVPEGQSPSVEYMADCLQPFELSDITQAVSAAIEKAKAKVARYAAPLKFPEYSDTVYVLETESPVLWNLERTAGTVFAYVAYSVLDYIKAVKTAQAEYATLVRTADFRFPLVLEPEDLKRRLQERSSYVLYLKGQNRRHREASKGKPTPRSTSFKDKYAEKMLATGSSSKTPST